jgi:hypothetical protein
MLLFTLFINYIIINLDAYTSNPPIIYTNTTKSYYIIFITY